MNQPGSSPRVDALWVGIATLTDIVLPVCTKTPGRSTLMFEK
jgi:hypothetical protein